MDTARRRLLAGIGGLSLGAAVSAVQPRQANASETSSSLGVKAARVKAARTRLLLQLTTPWKGHTADTKEKEEITQRVSELLAILSGQRRRHSSRDQPCSMAIGSRLLAGSRLPEVTHRHPILSGALVAWV
jgi:hypothetical protein